MILQRAVTWREPVVGSQRKRAGFAASAFLANSPHCQSFLRSREMVSTFAAFPLSLFQT